MNHGQKSSFDDFHALLQFYGNRKDLMQVQDQFRWWSSMQVVAAHYIWLHQELTKDPHGDTHFIKLPLPVAPL